MITLKHKDHTTMKLKLRRKLVHRVNNFWKRGNYAEIICLSLPDDNRLQQIEIIHLIMYVNIFL